MDASMLFAQESAANPREWRPSDDLLELEVPQFPDGSASRYSFTIMAQSLVN
jgi:hypothetical protein